MRKSRIDNKIPLYIWLLMGLFTVIKIWLAAGQSLSAREAAVHDDRLFLSLAQNLLEGKWLGAFDQFTLIKGPFYSIWIAIAFISGFPLLLSQHLLYIGASLIFCISIRPLLSKPIYMLGLFTVLLFNPMTYTDETMTRVIRDGIYPALTLLIFSCAVGLLILANKYAKWVWLWSVSLGLFLAAFWLTREEGIWLLPSIGIIVLFSVYRSWKSRKLEGGWLKPLYLWGSAFILAFVLVSFVSLLNLQLYGLYAKTEFDARPFKSAYGALSRVKPKETLPKVPVSKQTRREIYQLSPAFSELEPYLEGEIGEMWAQLGEKEEANKDEILGGWFMWALRDAVNSAGYYASGKFPAAYYNRLDDEIDAACSNESLDCFPDRATFFPPWSVEFVRPFFSYLWRGGKFFVTFDGFNPTPSASHGTSENLNLFYDLTRERLQDTDDYLNVSGWAVDEDSKVNIYVRNIKGSLVGTKVEIIPSPDVYNYFVEQGTFIPNANEARFELTTPCLKDCVLEFVTDDTVEVKLPLKEDMSDRQLDKTEDFFFVIDSSSFISDRLPFQDRYDNFKIKVLDIIGQLYQTLTPIFLVISIIGYCYLSIMLIKKDYIMIRWVILTSMLMGAFARLLIVALVSVTSWSAINTTYLASAYPLLLIFITLTLIWSYEDLDLFIKEKAKAQTMTGAGT